MAAVRRRLMQIGIVILIFAVVLCLFLPMNGGSGTGVAMACCFVLAALLSLALVTDRPPIGFMGSLARDRDLAIADVQSSARAPDPVALGVLLN